MWECACGRANTPPPQETGTRACSECGRVYKLGGPYWFYTDQIDESARRRSKAADDNAD